MTVTLQGDLQVPTADFRAALKAVFPHRSKVKTGDDLSERRIRLTFAAGWLYVTASNGSTTALAKVEILDGTDTRTTLGKLDPDDGPVLVDLDTYRVQVMQQLFKLGGNDDDTQQSVAVHLSMQPDKRFIRMTSLGGVREGDQLQFPLLAPEEMPDVITITGRALAEMGADPSSKPLVVDPAMLELFSDAGEAYGAKLEIRATGDAQQSGFLVKAGPDFVGTVESHHGLDGLAKRDQWHQNWLFQLPILKVAS